MSDVKRIKLKSGHKYALLSALSFIVSIICVNVISFTEFGMIQFLLMMGTMIGMFAGVIIGTIGFVESGASKKFGKWLNSDD